MATLERIRQRSGLLIIMVGLAMLAFILTDFLSSGNFIFNSNARIIGKVNGRAIDIKDFSTRIDDRLKTIRQQNPEQAENISQKQLADVIWNELLREKILGKQHKKLGFQITPPELYDKIKQNPSIQEAPSFKDQVTGSFSEGLFQQYLDNLRYDKDVDQQAAEYWNQWVNFENAIKDEALNQKYNKAVQKGLYIPTAYAKEEYIRNNTHIGFNYLVLQYNTIADSTIEVSEDELKDYYKENKEDYKTKETRDIEYVNFPINPSDQDLEDIKNGLSVYLNPEVVFNQVESKNDTFPSFANTKDDSAYAITRSDLPVKANYYKKGSDLSAELDSILFEKEVGYIHGPYEENDYFKLTKISDIKNIPDSANSRHILISFQGANTGQNSATRTPQEARALADSLLSVVRNDTSKFAELAKDNSDDPGSGSKGGKLGWFDDKTMVESFSRFSFTHKVGNIGLVYTNFGFHIIEILDQKGANKGLKLVNIVREINPSDETFERIYNEASQFASQINNIEEFSSLAEEKGYTPRPVTNLAPFDEAISGLGQNREIIRWVHNKETKLGDIQLLNNNNASSVVVIITASKNEGYADIEDVEDQIKPKVIRKKKAAMLSEKMRKAIEDKNDLNVIASELSVNVKSHNTNFNNLVIPDVGREPKVVGVISSLEPNVLSRPIEGERGIYIIQVTTRDKAAKLQEYSQEQEKLINSIRPTVSSVLFSTLKDQSNIVDRRAIFY